MADGTQELSLAELQSRKAARETARKAAQEALVKQELELDEKYSEKLGARGVDFEIVTTAIGNFVIHKPEFVVAKRFNSVEKQSDEDVVQFACACVAFPDVGTCRTMFMTHGGVAWRCSNAAMKLYAAEGEGRVGKY